MSGPVSTLVQHRWREHLDDQPSAAGPLRASEWLVASEVTPLDRVWAASNQGPAVVATPHGAGVVVVSGALDAWRHRGSDGAHDRFWRGTVAGLAMTVGAAVDLQTVAASPGHEADAHVTVRARTVREADTWEAQATRVCDDGETTSLRLWPSDGAGAFAARVPVGSRTGCRVVVQVAGMGQSERRVPDSGSRSSHRWAPADMDAIAARTGGLVVRDGRVDPLVRGWLDARGRERRPETRYPMRAWWWVWPFVMCLAGEWWLRRRAGLR